MYNDQVAAQIKQVASNAMDSTETKIGEIHRQKQVSRNKAIDNLSNWRNQIGNISFSLAAVSSAILVAKNSPSAYVFASLLTLLFTGIWITLLSKTRYEREISTATVEFDKVAPLYIDKKKAAFDLWEQPNDPSKHINFLEKELAIQMHGRKLTSKNLRAIKNDKPDYRNDVWIALFLSAIYLLLHSYFIELLNQYLSSPAIESFYWLLLILALLVLARQASQDVTQIKKYNEMAMRDIKNDIKHAKQYIERIQEEISNIRRTFNI